MDEDKRLVADWISGCNDMLAEIEFLLDKAYPDGAEDRFYHEWEIVLEHMHTDKGEE
jgi:hypothetical protein